MRSSRDENEVAAITDAPIPVNEVLTLSVTCNGEVGRGVRLLECRPMMHEGSVAYGLRLAVLEQEARCGTSLMGKKGGGDFFGVLTREVAVRLLNISRSGCLLASPGDLCLGTTGEVRVHSDRGEYRDNVRVTRCQVVREPGATHLLGAAFLWTSPPTRGSLRSAIRRPWHEL